MATNQQRYITRETQSVLSAFGINKHQLISLVGGGGKTSTMFEIAKLAYASNYSVIVTSTTHIMKPTLDDVNYVLSKNPDDALDFEETKKQLNANKLIAVISENSEERVVGIEPNAVDKLFEDSVSDVIVCEADGASRRPIKCPKETEPVFPRKTNVVISVIGMDAYYTTIGSDKTFRDEYICKVTGLNMGDELDDEAIAKIVTDEHGLNQYAPESAEIIPFLNKIDLARKRDGVELAKIILSKNHSQIKKVVIGSIQNANRGFTVVEKI